MRKTIATVIAVVAILALPLSAEARVFICVDAATGVRTFTDHACPNQGRGAKVKVTPTNFGAGTPTQRSRGVWTSDRPEAVSGPANYEQLEGHRVTEVIGHGTVGR